MVPSSAPRPALGTRTHAQHLARVLSACTALTALATLTACTTGASRYASYDVAPRRAPLAAPSTTLRTLDASALRRTPYDFLFDAVNAYWPAVGNPPFTVTSLAMSGSEPVGVYANGMFIGGLDALREVRVNEVARVRRITTAEENLQFGRQHRAGAILVEWLRAPASKAPR